MTTQLPSLGSNPWDLMLKPYTAECPQNQEHIPEPLVPRISSWCCSWLPLHPQLPPLPWRIPTILILLSQIFCKKKNLHHATHHPLISIMLCTLGYDFSLEMWFLSTLDHKLPDGRDPCSLLIPASDIQAHSQCSTAVCQWMSKWLNERRSVLIPWSLLTVGLWSSAC